MDINKGEDISVEYSEGSKRPRTKDSNLRQEFLENVMAHKGFIYPNINNIRSVGPAMQASREQ